MGQNPTFPGLGEANPSSNNLDSSSKALKVLKEIDDARVKFREADCSAKLKKVRSERINPSVERFYRMGDPVLFRDAKKKQWKQGIALVRFGKTLYLKHGNWLRRVPVDTVIPDCIGFEKQAESEFDPDSFVDDESGRFVGEETSTEEMATDIDTAKENLELKSELEELKKKMLHYETIDLKLTAEGASEPENEEELKKLKRKSRKERKKVLKSSPKKMPVLGQYILFKENSHDEWLHGKVFGVYKKNSKHKYIKQIELPDGKKIEKDFDNDIYEWRPVSDDESENEESVECVEPDIRNDGEVLYPVEVVKRKDYSKPDVQEAMRIEIQKYKQFNAFEEVDDRGQACVPIRWVVTRQSIDGKNQPLKARMCIRGDLESDKETMRADSPTAGKDTLKIALSIAANEGFEVKNIDIKSAYLQGKDLDREILVKPPVEAKTDKLCVASQEGSVWRA